MAGFKTKYKSKRVKDFLNTIENEKKRLDCFDLLKMASQQETDKKIQDVLVVSNLLANFQRLIHENFISTSLTDTLNNK
ncbi:hypothetical protein [Emticicia sp. 17c]|uniref:hypothetical protein n=1 Tax=Emticicia sp. 17c TaxID=3127704 RepID=UPI00301D4390